LLTHLLQSALSIGADLAFAFPALLLVQKQSPASGVRNTVAWAEGPEQMRKDFPQITSVSSGSKHNS
jgi:hypothetical protein